MLSATYNVPASDWTRALDAALAKWSNYLTGDADMQIELLFDPSISYLATASPRWWFDAGKENGRTIKIPSAVVDLLTGENKGWGATDIRMTVNPDYPWYFGDPANTPTNQYSAVSTMLHELGHGLYATSGGTGADTPFSLWAEQNADHHDTEHGSHLRDKNAAMYYQGRQGPGNELSPIDILSASQSGLATGGNDTLYLPKDLSGITAYGGAGDDTAVWLSVFDDFDTNLVDIEKLHLKGENPLTNSQRELYQLYEAAFGRAPDLDGFRYWSKSGEGIEDLSEHFAASDEFASLYGGDRKDFLTGLYRNVLGRDPDEEGYQHWLGRTDMNNADLLRSFALSDENGLGFSPEFTI